MSQNKISQHEISDSDSKFNRDNESPLLKIVNGQNIHPSSKIMSSNNLELMNGNFTLAHTTGTEPTLDVTNSQKILQHQSFIEQQKSYGLVLSNNNSQISSLPQTTDHRNVTLNSQCKFLMIDIIWILNLEVNGQLPFRVKSLPKKSWSFGNPPTNVQNILQNNLLVNGNGSVMNNQMLNPQFLVPGNGVNISHNTTFYGQ